MVQQYPHSTIWEEIIVVIICYYNYTSKRAHGKPMPKGGYNNTEPQYGVRTKYVPSPGGVKTKPIPRHSDPRDKKSKSRCMQLLDFLFCRRQAH